MQRYRSTFIQLFISVKLIQQNPFGKINECLQVQETLIERISYVESMIRKRRSRIKECKTLLSNPENRLPKAQASDTKKQIESAESQITEYQIILHHFREIGDALAFIYLPKWDIKPMAFKQSTGFISKDKGSCLERKRMREVFSNGYVAILNDLTNCLRYGDITVIDKDFNYTIYEIKLGEKLDRRGKKQVKKIAKLCDYLSTGETNSLYPETGRMLRVSYHAPEINHNIALSNIIHDAKNTGNVFRQVEDGLFHVVLTGKITPALEKEILNMPLGPPIVVMVNQFKRKNVGSYPFTLSFNDPEDLFDFYLGNYTLLVIIDKGYVDTFFKKLGYATIWDNDGDWILELRVCDTRLDTIPRMKIGRHLWDRISTEFLSLDWFLDGVRSRLLSKHPKKD